MTDASLASGTYEVLRNRLRQSADDLRSRFQQLHAARATVFGNIETRLSSTVHIVTEHNCIPRDLFVHSGNVLLGYNVQFGLKTEIDPTDVLAAFRFDGQHMHELPLDNYVNAAFQRDFQELYRYYRNATFSRFFANGPNLYMVFQIGKTSENIKAFKWVIDGDRLHYVDNRSDAEVRLPTQHSFQWKRATRESHRHGMHSHISIEDRVFVECIHGDLTVKVEDNTEDGLGIYREPVESPDQTLDDAETYYAIVQHLVLLKIRPYQEKDFRYLVFSTKRSTVERMDTIGDACLFLPDDHGVIFPNGFVLQTGVSKQFEHGLSKLSFDRLIKSPNGEDFLFLFVQPDSGTCLHLRYNLIRQEVDTPLICHGHGFFSDGQMLLMRANDSPQKHHALQVWQTPFTGPDFQPTLQTDSLLFKIGNRDLVRGMAECQELLTLIDKDESYVDLYADLAKRATNVLDSYFWLDREEAFTLAQPIQAIRETASAAVDEYQKVVRVRNETNAALQKVDSGAQELIQAVERSRFESVADFVEKLSALRSQRGAAIQLRELRYIELERVDGIESRLAEASDRLGLRCVQFLLAPDALKGYAQQIASLNARVPSIDSAANAKKLEQELTEIGNSLELLIETVSQLKIDDLAQRTSIVDRVGDCLAELNRVRSTLRMRLRDLTTRELEADFASQSKMLDQATASSLDTADAPDKIDAALTRILLQIEEIEGRYADSETLLLRLTEKRQMLCDAFEAKRQQLVEVRTRRANGLVAAADRILTGIASKADRIDDPAELHAYFAADLMVEKIRNIADQLAQLDDSVRRDDVLSRLKTIADDALRQQRDRRDLLTDGNRAIRLGEHSFSVNQQPIELTTVVRDGSLHLHLTGTQFFEPMSNPELDNAKDLWDQPLPSESEQVYRGEYLAYTLAIGVGCQPVTASAYLEWDQDARIAWIREMIQSRYNEGYARGVHDRDAAIILAHYLQLERQLGSFAYSAKLRSLSTFAWRELVPEQDRMAATAWIHSFANVDRILVHSLRNSQAESRIRSLLKKHAADMLRTVDLRQSAQFLLTQIESQPIDANNEFSMVASQQALELSKLLREHVTEPDWRSMNESWSNHAHQPREAWQVALRTVDGFLSKALLGTLFADDPAVNYREEVACYLLLNRNLPEGSNALPKNKRSLSISEATPVCVELKELSGDHPRIANGSMKLHFHEFRDRLGRFANEVVPRWNQFQQTKQTLLEKASKRLRSHEFKAKVLTSFVRNQLIDEVYLPRVGDNLAKQMGTVGENKRTDRMGLLLLVSPPGYGKTTLMEYIANRLGLVFVKINGPAIGHSVTSLDPSEASNASAREEVQRINMALEMGDNTMLYLDDIQHCNVELLQKFIPLCDATRRIEGVWNGQSRNYDLRGRKFAVVMAGNPYTETGERFQIPDMLANRADVYNLGEIIGASHESFEQSYLENCLTSNTVLQPLARATHADQVALIAAAKRGDSQEGLSLESNLSTDAVAEMLSVLRKLNRVRDVVLMMNREYIHSAAQADDYRTEPPFKLQGSYRNMNRIAEKVVSVMNDQELDALIVSSYQQDAQTLSRDGESNILKFKVLMGIATPMEQQRWETIKKTFSEKTKLRGMSGDESVAQMLVSMLGLRDGLDSIRLAVENASATREESVRKQVDASSVDPKIIVQHAVPRVMTELIRSQFQLLYDGLRPVLEKATQQSVSSDRLRTVVEELLERYRAMEAVASKAPKDEEDESA
jgi:hypothetical protein